jgi:hypothetical protein
MADNYYAFTISAIDTGKTCYYGVQFTSQLTVLQGSFTFTPTGSTNTMVGTDATNINLNLPACARLSGGVTVITGASNVAGNIYVSPALSVPVTFALYGFSQIGSVTVQPGQTQASFNFDVSGQEALTAETAQAELNKVAPQAERPNG